jgi:dTDP-6-deoxy-L-talose 4-dehydrogenase (NAD+)
MRILVTGATGFLGKHIVEYLLEQTHEIICTHLRAEDYSNIGWHTKVEWIVYDLNEPQTENLFDYFKQPEALIHLAWAGLPDYNSRVHIEANLLNHELFIKNLVESGLKNVTITGTCQEYGMQNGLLNESLPTLPETYYAIAKDTLHKLINQLNEKFNFSFKWLRLFYMYGEGQNEKSIIPQLLKAIKSEETIFNMSAGEQLRDYLPVKELAAYVGKLALQTEFIGAINCCSGVPISIRKLVENIIQEYKSNIKLNLGYYPYPTYEPFAFWGDNSKLMKILSLID